MFYRLLFTWGLWGLTSPIVTDECKASVKDMQKNVNLS